MSRLLVTIATGPEIDYGRLTIPRMHDYAKRCRADLWVITHCVFGEMHDATHGCAANPSWWKVPLIKWFAGQSLYSSMAFVDADVHIPRAADNIFEVPELKGFSMTVDMNSQREFPLWAQWAAEKYPEFPVSPKWEIYANAGVWAVQWDAACRISFAMSGVKNLYSRWFEQDFLNLMTLSTGTRSFLPQKFNQPVPFKSLDVSDRTGFFHLCGLAQQNKLAWLERMEKAELTNDPTL